MGIMFKDIFLLNLINMLELMATNERVRIFTASLSDNKALKSYFYLNTFTIPNAEVA